MIGFWIAAGLLVVGALLFLVPPLVGRRGKAAVAASHDEANLTIYRDQLKELEADLAAGSISEDQYGRAKGDIEKRLVEEVGEAEKTVSTRATRGLAVGLGIGLPVAALGLYMLLGTPEGLDPGKVVAAEEGGAHAITKEQIAAMADSLAEKLKSNPEDVEGWAMLARSYNVLGRHAESAQAFAKAVALVPDNAQLLADYADTLAMAQGRKLEGEPERLIQRALAADPRNVKALALAGTIAFQRQDYAAAAKYWQDILGVVPPDSEFAQQISRSIADARQRMGQPPATTPVGAPVAASGAGNVSGTVRLSSELAGKVSPTDTVFIFARAVEGPRAPLAIQRRQVKDLPLDFVLDDSMSMAPEMRLSKFPKVLVGARVSRSGNATPQPGDLQGTIGPVSVGSRDLVVTIDNEVKP